MTKNYDTLARMLDSSGFGDKDYMDDLIACLHLKEYGTGSGVVVMVMASILECVTDTPTEAEDPKACYWMIY